MAADNRNIPAASSQTETASLSNLACQSCRRRKAKCDRTFPCCSVCVKTMQQCIYPAVRLRSGPKIGSSQRSGKRARPRASQSNYQAGNNDHDSRLVTSPLSAEIDREYPNENENNFATNQRSRQREDHALYPDLAFSPPQNYMPSPPIAAEDDVTATGDSINGIHLSYIIHPAHETSIMSPSEDDTEQFAGLFPNPTVPSEILLDICEALDISDETFRKLLQSYFFNMTEFSLFHQPSFGTKIQNAKSPTSVKALISAMFSYSARFVSSSTSQFPPGTPSHEIFHDLACTFIEEAMKEYWDEVPSLCLLQALILTTFYQLVKGVRGRAWRFLGLCVRIAYEKNLHLVDCSPSSGKPPVGVDEITRWCFDEERRRSWWGIWEMDVFASTIRRCPTAIDWAQNQTYLPVKDELWYDYSFHTSCHLAQKPTQRWKVLQESKNHAPGAWFIVLNSLMYDAQALSMLEKVIPFTQGGTITSNSERKQEAQGSLTIIDNALRCSSFALPEELQWHGEFLSFTGTDPATAISNKRLHNAKYSIYLMVQLANFMIHHQYGLEKAISEKDIRKDCASNANYSSKDQGSAIDGQSLTRYLDSAENILAIVNSSADNHVKYVNPFLASTLWLAAAVQLVSMALQPEGSNTDLIESKFDILRMRCQQYAKFWNTPVALLQNLDSLKEQLHIHVAKKHRTEWMNEEADLRGKSNRELGARGDESCRSTMPAAKPPYNHADISRDLDFSPVILNFPEIQFSSTDKPNGAEVTKQPRTDSASGHYTARAGIPGKGHDNGNQKRNQNDTIDFETSQTLPDVEMSKFWDGMELDFQMDTDVPWSLNGLLFKSYSD